MERKEREGKTDVARRVTQWLSIIYMQSAEKKKFLIYAGVGLVTTGVAFIAFIYLFSYLPATQGNGDNDGNANAGEGEERQQQIEPAEEAKLVMHEHVTLSVTAGGQQVEVPKDIGIAPELWKDHSLDEYGVPGVSPLHTHDTSGVVHIESAVKRQYTLGEFLDVWGIEEDSIIRVSTAAAGGSEVHADYRQLVLADGLSITLEIEP